MHPLGAMPHHNPLKNNDREQTSDLGVEARVYKQDKTMVQQTTTLAPLLTHYMLQAHRNHRWLG
jgi:hypothetical protein